MEKANNEGFVKGVLSGDFIVVSGKLKKGSDDVPEEKNIYLSMLSAPKINAQQSYEEDFCGWESRNYLRNQVIGKVVKYTVDYNQGENVVGQVFIDGKNLNIELVRKGLAKVNQSKSNENLTKTDFYKQIMSAQLEAEKAKIGIWRADRDKAKLTKVTKQDEVDVKDLFEKIKGKEINGMIEVAFNCAGCLIYLKDYSCIIKASLRFVAIPNKETFFYKAGKAYVERLFLHRDCKIRAFHVDDNKNFTVDITDSRINPTTGKPELKNLALMVLNSGYSKLYVSTNFTNDLKDVEAAKDAQAKAQLNAIRVWEGYIKKPEKEVKTSTINSADKGFTFEGFVYNVHSGDSLSIKGKDGVVRRVFFSHVKSPAFANKNANEEDKPWAWQSKEYLRKTAIGKNVRAEFEFAKEMKEGRIMNFYSVVMKNEDGKETNLNADVLENGLAICNPPRGNDNDVSNYLEKYIQAEVVAKEKKIGVHSTKSPGIPMYCDIANEDPKKKRDMIPRNQSLKSTFCVVEYVYSATKFKLRIDKTTCFIPFKLVGLRCVEKDKNNSKQLDELNLLGADFASEKFLQREGVVDIVQADKSGNYFGVLTVKGVNVGSTVLESGHALIYNPQKNYLPTEYKEKEAIAKKNKLGIWGCQGLATILTEGEVDVSTSGSGLNQTKKYEEKDENVKIRVTDMVDFKHFFVNIIPNKTLSTIEKTLSDFENGNKVGVPLDPPIKKGTLCIVKYSDLKYYRVRILNIMKEEMEVEFLDYGTVDVVSKRNLFKMEDSISTLPPQVVECELAGLKYSKNSLKKSMDLFPDFIDLENILPARIAYSYVSQEGKPKVGLVIYFEKQSNIKESIHHDLLSKGYAKIDKKKPQSAAIKEFLDIEKAAKTKSTGMWAEMEESDNEDEENLI